MPLQLTTLSAQIVDWANRQDWSPALVQSFIAMAERKFNTDLRVSEMMATSLNTVTGRCSTLPTDWLESYLTSIANSNAPSGWLPIRYKSNDEFFNLNDWRAFGYYTIVGRVINFGGVPDALEGIQYKLVYFQAVPPLNDVTDSWVYTKYQDLYLWTSLAKAALHAQGEEAAAANFEQLSDGIIKGLNSAWLKAKASGSRVTRTRVRSFG